MKYQVIVLPAAKADIKAAAKWIRQNDSTEIFVMFFSS